jgi:hypothetical protein
MGILCSAKPPGFREVSLGPQPCCSSSIVRAELDTNVAVLTALERVTRRYENPLPADVAATWVRGEDGDFHEAAPGPGPSERP